MNVIQLLAVVVACSTGVFSQFPRFGNRMSMAQRPQRSMGSRYLTCIGQTANNDQLRVTFSNHQNGRAVKVQANVQGGMSSQINGNFQLVITSGGRIDGMCDPNALGQIMTMSTSTQNRMGMFAMRPQQQNSNSNSRLLTIGSQFSLRSDQSVSMTDILSGITYSRLAGSGMAVCQGVVGNRCVGSMPLCCTIAKDGKTAAPSLSRGLVGGMDQGFGMNNGMNSMNGMNGMNGMNSMNNLNPNNQGVMSNTIAGTNSQNSLVFP